jgi:hypothetical protein
MYEIGKSNMREQILEISGASWGFKNGDVWQLSINALRKPVRQAKK